MINKITIGITVQIISILGFLSKNIHVLARNSRERESHFNSHFLLRNSSSITFFSPMIFKNLCPPIFRRFPERSPSTRRTITAEGRRKKGRQLAETASSPRETGPPTFRPNFFSPRFLRRKTFLFESTCEFHSIVLYCNFSNFQKLETLV